MNLILIFSSSRNELSHPVMGTIFLVGRASHVQSRFRMIYMYICMYVCMYVGISSIVYGNTIQKNRMLKCMGGITSSKHAHAQKAVLGF